MLKSKTCLAVLVALVSVGAGGCCCFPPKPQMMESAFEPAPAAEPAALAEPAAPPPEAPPPPAAKEAPPPPVKPLPAPVVFDLRALARRYPNLLALDEASGRLRFAADLLFDSGSATVKPDARAALGTLGGILTSDAAKELRVDIVGHTDSVPVKKSATVALLKGLGKPANNQGLSEARAEAVADILKAARVDAARITTKGMGESQPIADNRTAAGKAQNRRVEVYVWNP